MNIQPCLTNLSIPQIVCPCCGTRMRLTTVEPDAAANRQRMTFACSCGFDYRLSPAVMIEQTL